MRWGYQVGACAAFAAILLVSVGLLTARSADAGRATGTLSVRVVVVAPSCGGDGGRDCESVAGTASAGSSGQATGSRELPVSVREDRYGDVVVRTLVY